MPDHILRDRDIMIDLPVVHLELQPHEVGKDGGSAGLRANRRLPLAGFGAGDGETAAFVVSGEVLR